MSQNVWPNRTGRPATTPGTTWPLRGRWDGEPGAPPEPPGEPSLIYAIEPHKVYDEWAARTGEVAIDPWWNELAWVPTIVMQGATGTASTFMRLSKSIVIAAAGVGSGSLALTAGAPLFDDFSSDTIANYATAIGNIATWQVTGGVLHPTAGGDNGVIYNTTLSAADVRAKVKLVSGGDNGVVLRIAGDSGLMFRNPDAFGGFALFSFNSGGGFTLLDNQGQGVGGVSYIELQKVGNVVTMRTYDASDVLLETKTYTLTGGDATTFGAGVVAYGGVRRYSGADFDNLTVASV